MPFRVLHALKGIQISGDTEDEAALTDQFIEVDVSFEAVTTFFPHYWIDAWWGKKQFQ